MANNQLGVPDPELLPLLAAFPVVEGTTDFVAARAWFSNQYVEMVHGSQRKFLPPEDAYVVESHVVPVLGGEIAVRSYRPSNSQELPLLVWFHGGGWVVGDLNVDDYLLRTIAVELRLVIVNVDYRLAPEHPFPTGHDDAYAGLKWAVDNRSPLKADLHKGLLVGGISAGGNLAAAIAHRALSDPFFSEYPVTGQVLSVSIFCHLDAIPEQYKERLTSYEQNTATPLMKTGDMRIVCDALGASPSDPDAFPLLQPSCRGLPPAYFQICGMDPLRDEGLLYAEKLKADSVAVRADVYPGAPHTFHISFPETKLAEKYRTEFKEGIRWLLSLA